MKVDIHKFKFRKVPEVVETPKDNVTKKLKASANVAAKLKEQAESRMSDGEREERADSLRLSEKKMSDVD